VISVTLAQPLDQIGIDEDPSLSGLCAWNISGLCALPHRFRMHAQECCGLMQIERLHLGVSV